MDVERLLQSVIYFLFVGFTFVTLGNAVERARAAQIGNLLWCCKLVVEYGVTAFVCVFFMQLVTPGIMRIVTDGGFWLALLLFALLRYYRTAQQ